MNNKQELQEKLVNLALSQLGKPYKYGVKAAEAPAAFDCSLFTQWCFAQIGISIGRATIDQAYSGKKVDWHKKKIEPGDLIFIRSKKGHYSPKFPSGIGHVYLVLDDKQAIHAKYRKIKGVDAGQVEKKSMALIMKRSDITVIKRLI